jgi:hypothetical protein
MNAHKTATDVNIQTVSGNPGLMNDIFFSGKMSGRFQTVSFDVSENYIKKVSQYTNIGYVGAPYKLYIGNNNMRILKLSYNENVKQYAHDINIETNVRDNDPSAYSYFENGDNFYFVLTTNEQNTGKSGIYMTNPKEIKKITDIDLDNGSTCVSGMKEIGDKIALLVYHPDLSNNTQDFELRLFDMKIDKFVAATEVVKVNKALKADYNLDSKINFDMYDNDDILNLVMQCDDNTKSLINSYDTTNNKLQLINSIKEDYNTDFVTAYYNKDNRMLYTAVYDGLPVGYNPAYKDEYNWKLFVKVYNALSQKVYCGRVYSYSDYVKNEGQSDDIDTYDFRFKKGI